MSLNNFTMLGNTTYGVANGPYNGSSADFLSYPAQGAAYYGGQGSLQTVFIATAGFSGNVVIKGSLDSLVEEAAWAKITEFDNSSPANAITGITPLTFTGRFVWLQAEIIDYTAGNIAITVSY